MKLAKRTLQQRCERHHFDLSFDFFFCFTRRMTLSSEHLVIAFFYCTNFLGRFNFLPVSLYTLSVMLTLWCLFAYNRYILRLPKLDRYWRKAVYCFFFLLSTCPVNFRYAKWIWIAHTETTKVFVPVQWSTLIEKEVWPDIHEVIVHHFPTISFMV